MKPCHLFCFLLPLFAISACNLLPERRAGDAGAAIPQQWSEYAAEQSVAVNWVETFQDATLKQLVDRALENNYELKAAAARIQAATAQARIDGSPRWPQLFFSADYQEVQIRDAGFGSARYNVFEALFGVSWEVDLWGRIRDSHLAAITETTAVQADFQGTRLSLAARVAQSYFELIEAELQSDVIEQSIKDRGVIADLVRGRFQRGLVRGLDLRLALNDLANAEAQLKQARNRVQQISKRLEILLGNYPEDKVWSITRLPLLPAAIPAGLPSELLERRPDLIA
ncbi:MAG: TolC family protein, partial [Nitrosomonas sp.]|nr:TolC family protein [Nitrosomonas sp.]